METTAETKQAPNTPTLDKEFTEDIQRHIVAMLIYDQEITPELAQKIRPEYFENPVLSDSVNLIVKFYERYERRPTIDEFIQGVTTMLDSSKVPKPPEVYWEQIDEMLTKGYNADFAFIRDELDAWIRYQTIKNAFLKGIGLLPLLSKII